MTPSNYPPATPPDDLESDPFSDPYADRSRPDWWPDEDGEYDDPTMRSQTQKPGTQD